MIETVQRFYGIFRRAASAPQSPFLLPIRLCRSRRFIETGLGHRNQLAFVAGYREALLAVFSDPPKFQAASAYTVLFASLPVPSFGPAKFRDALMAPRFETRSVTA